MPKATEFTVFSGVLADDDHFILLDASEIVSIKDKRIAVAHARKQLVRAITSASDPTVDDDDTEGYVAGNLWLNTSDDGLFVCVSASTGAADWDEFGAGTGDVTGPGSATDDNFASFNGTGGKTIQDAGVSAASFATAAQGALADTAVQPGDTSTLQSFVIACSDETTELTTGAAKVTFRVPYAFTVTAVKAAVTAAPTGSAISLGINEGGTSILSTDLTIDATEKTSATAATPAVVSDSSLAADAEMTIDLDAVGSTYGGAGLKVTIIGRPT